MAAAVHSVFRTAWDRWSKGSLVVRSVRAAGHGRRPLAGSAVGPAVVRAAPYTLLMAVFFGLVLAVAVPALRVSILALCVLAAGCWFWPLHAGLVLPFVLMLGIKMPFFTVGDELLFVRPEHALLTGAGLSLLRGPLARNDHPLLTAWAAMLAAFSVASLAGQIRGTAGNPVFALLPLAQFTAWAFVLVCARASALRFGEAGLWAWFVPAATVAAFGIVEWFRPFEDVAGYRTFERGFFEGQANHMGGLFAMAVALCAAFLACPKWRAPALLTGGMCMAALLTTGSKEALAAAGVGLCAVVWLRFTRLRLPVVLAVALLGAWLLSWPPSRLTQAGSSLADRFEAWRNVSVGIMEHPLFGIGFGARHRSYYDSLCVMVLAETGIIGLGAFLYWLVAHIGALAHEGSPRKGNVFALGAFGAWTALACQSLASVGFLVTVMGGPAAWLCGYAIGLGERERV